MQVTLAQLYAYGLTGINLSVGKRRAWATVVIDDSPPGSGRQHQPDLREPSMTNESMDLRALARRRGHRTAHPRLVPATAF
jgi:hypothetical protein